MFKTTAKAGIIGHAVGCALSQKPKNTNGRRLVETAYLCYAQAAEAKEQFRLISEIPTLQSETDVLGGFIFVNYLSRLMDKESPLQAYRNIKRENYIRFSEKARREYHPILQRRIEACTSIKKVTDDTASILQAALWCLITTSSFEQAILKATKLRSGTVCALVGAMAGVYYGIDAIPEEWSRLVA